MLDYPNYSDISNISNAQRDTWEYEAMLRWHYKKYYSGLVFEEKVPLEYSSDIEEVPLMYPVGINLVKMLCIAQAESLFGEWEDDIVRWKVRQDIDESTSADAAVKLAHSIMQANLFTSLGYELSMDREVYGGCAYKVSPEFGRGMGHIRVDKIDLDGFAPIWNPDDPWDLLEVYIKSVMTREQARLKYGIDTDKDKVIRIERWSKTDYENTVDGKRIDAFSGANPYRMVPVGFIPRIRTESWWGDPLTPDIIPTQDELNARIADLGESINYNAHPIKWGKNLPRTFNSTNFPLDAQEMWDLGKTIGSSPEPEVGLLEAQNVAPPGAFEYVNFLYDWSRTSSFSPPIAFGEDNGGGQRSGRTLEIRMWPLLRSTRRSRSYMSAGLQQMMKIAAKIILQKEIPNLGHAAQRLYDGDIVPSFWPLLPKDMSAIVDQIVKLSTLPVPTISLATAHKWLGMGPGEEDRIREMINDPDYKDLIEGKKQDTNNAENMANKKVKNDES